MSSSSRIFVKSRALGYVSNHIPVVIRYIERRKECVMVTCVSRHFHTYSSAHLALLNVSGAHEEDITSLAADRFLVYTASGKHVLAWRMGTQIKHRYEGHRYSVHLLLPFGPHLISVDDQSHLKMWDIKSEELYTELEFDNKSFQITSLMHPVTYVNKILLGSEQGQLQLWNMHTRKLIFTFSGWHSAVMVMEQAPAVDVVALGLADGRILLHNLKFDRTVMEFSQDWGSVTAISFRQDGPAVMVTGTGAGHLLLWDLEKKCSAGQMWDAHHGAVTGVQCLPSEPIMVTTSPDNSLKMWIFDMPDDSARLLKLREGHSLPPTTIKFHGTHQVFSAGADSSLRVFSTVSETKNHSYGRAVFDRKKLKTAQKKQNRDYQASLLMPPIVSLACEPTREKDWDDIAAVHRGLAEVTSWSSYCNKMGEHKFLHDRFKELKSAVATCACLTMCGNFVVIGYSSGHVDRFNMQSGQHRAHYARQGDLPAHDGATRGVAVEGLNHAVVTGGADSMLRFWQFKDAKLLTTLPMTEAIAFFTHQRESSLLGAALDDNSVCVVDMDSRSVVRRLPSHTSRLTALEFSADSRWLLVASMDCLIRTWDVPSAHLVDVFRTPAATTAISLNCNGSLLATSHVGYLGVFIWVNRALHTHVSLRPISLDSEVPLVELPMPGECDGEVMELLEEDTTAEYTSPAQLSEQLVTLSSLPTSRWLNVLDLDVVKRRNKPKQAPTIPKAAPFFLPTVPALELQFDVTPSPGDQGVGAPLVSDMSGLGRSLLKRPLQDTVQMLSVLGPSALDAEILNLAPEGGGSLQVQVKFLELLKHMFSKKSSFELGQTYLALFLKHHADSCIEEAALSDLLRDLGSGEAWATLENKLLYCMSVVAAFKSL